MDKTLVTNVSVVPLYHFSHTLTRIGTRHILKEDDDGELSLDLKCLLAFITGADQPPPLGFQYRPKISFTDDKEASASTCVLCLCTSLITTISSRPLILLYVMYSLSTKLSSTSFQFVFRSSAMYIHAILVVLSSAGDISMACIRCFIIIQLTSRIANNGKRLRVKYCIV